MDDNNTYLHSHYKANHTSYYPIASLALIRAGMGYTTGQSLLEYLGPLGGQEPGVVLLHDANGFVGSLDCISKQRKMLGYCTCDDTKQYQQQEAATWAELSQVMPDFAFTVVNFRHCTFYLKAGQVFVYSYADRKSLTLADFTRQYCTEVNIRQASAGGAHYYVL